MLISRKSVFGKGLFAATAPASLWLLAQACGGTTADTPAQQDAGSDAAEAPDAAETPDANVPDTSNVVSPIYPAKHAPMPLVDNNGGRVIHNPKIVTITWANDDPTMVARLRQFDDTITGTAWWTAVASEYCEKGNNAPCIGKGSSGGHVVITDPLPMGGFTDSSQGGASTIQDFIKAHLASDPTFPQPTPDTIYSIYLPDGVAIDLDGSQGCTNGGFGAYHSTVDLVPGDGGLVTTAYSVTPRCGTDEATTTVSASHEYIEAATDPDIGQNNLTYYMLNQTWAFAGGEVGDLCVDFVGGNDKLTQDGFVIQRSWSNASAKAGHNPCVPVPSGEVYFQAAPRVQHVILKKVGDSAVVDVDAYSDAPIADWALSAVDFGQFQGGGTNLSFSFDQTTVNNGYHVQLTVKLTKALAQGATAFAVVSKGGKQQNYFWPVLVTQK